MTEQTPYNPNEESGRLRQFVAATLLATVAANALGMTAEATPVDAPSSVSGRIYANHMDGYSFDTVQPQHPAKLSHRPVTVAVEGDSMSAITAKSLYNIQPGSKMEVWYHRLPANFGLKFHVFAQGKSAVQQEGQIDPHSHPRVEGSGTNYMQRLEIDQIARSVTNDDLMIISGDFNDAKTKKNLPDGELVDASTGEVLQAMHDYVGKVVAMRTEAGHDPRTIIMTNLWAKGNRDSAREVLMAEWQALSVEFGTTFADVEGTFENSRRDTLDGTHYYGPAGDRIAESFQRSARLARLINRIVHPH